MHNATAITIGSANQRPNTPCIRLWIDVTFRGLEDSIVCTMQSATTDLRTCTCSLIHPQTNSHITISNPTLFREGNNPILSFYR